MQTAVTLRVSWIQYTVMCCLSQLFPFTSDLNYCVYEDAYKEEHFETYKYLYLSAQSHGNSHIFYEVANSYKFERMTYI